MNRNQIRVCYQKAVSLFNEKMGTDYSVENPKLFLVNRDNVSSVLDEIAALTGQNTSISTYTVKGKSFLDEALAEAFVGDLADAVAVNFPFVRHQDEESLVFEFMHELGHVFVLHQEWNGVIFAEHYYDDNPDHTRIRTGYEIWKEFIADYIAMNVCGRKSYLICEAYSYLQQEAKQLNPVINPYYYRSLSSYLVNLLYSREAKRGWDSLKKAMTSYKLPYSGLTEILIEHMSAQSYWKIDEEFLDNIGDLYVADAIKSFIPAA